MTELNKTNGQRHDKLYSVFTKALLQQKISLSITEIGNNLKQNLEKKLIFKNEGKCIPEGFVKPNSIRIIQYSSGLINLDAVDFYTVFECLVCYPVEGMLVECVVKTVTKAGIHAEVKVDNNVPIVVFVARDHHNTNKYFASIKENINIFVKIIGVRFELNDLHICAIGTLEHK
jgi:DNA-directed RNA polymerase subunit E'/Rpb7